MIILPPPPKKKSEVAHVDYDESFNTARRGCVNVISKNATHRARLGTRKFQVARFQSGTPNLQVQGVGQPGRNKT